VIIYSQIKIEREKKKKNSSTLSCWSG